MESLQLNRYQIQAEPAIRSVGNAEIYLIDRSRRTKHDCYVVTLCADMARCHPLRSSMLPEGLKQNDDKSSRCRRPGLAEIMSA